jgi:hypothetical protein
MFYHPTPDAQRAQSPLPLQNLHLQVLHKSLPKVLFKFSPACYITQRFICVSNKGDAGFLQLPAPVG